MVPIIGQFAAGKPILADEHIEAYLPCEAGSTQTSSSS
nr:MAG TPA: LexA repressor [Caudoviricetes sp.]